MNARLLYTGLIALAFSAAFTDARAQRSRVGIGAQVGEPGGFTARIYAQERIAYDVLGAFSGEGGVFGSVHIVRSAPLEASPLHYFAGPGVFFGFEGKGATRDEAAGFGLKVGLDYFTGPFEVHFHAVPRLYLAPTVRAHLGYGVGLRYFLPKARP